ncbi:hypothetical protein Syun_020812 [Stephania yunnanensis]|uniref:Uncharacterized protein n=1 Tax=Stephania yunnanensis TaxID=152371 RepID=A0AAP0IF59_9MAGN
MNGAVARCRTVGCAFSTKSRRRDGGTWESGVACANRDASDVLRFAFLESLGRVAKGKLHS